MKSIPVTFSITRIGTTNSPRSLIARSARCGIRNPTATRFPFTRARTILKKCVGIGIVTPSLAAVKSTLFPDAGRAGSGAYTGPEITLPRRSQRHGRLHTLIRQLGPNWRIVALHLRNDIRQAERVLLGLKCRGSRPTGKTKGPTCRDADNAEQDRGSKHVRW